MLNDISMLYYPFLSGRKKRSQVGLITVFIKINVLQRSLCGKYFGGFLLWDLLNGLQEATWYFIEVLFLLLTSLTALFSFHELFIYYLLQPFTGDMRVVNPVYKFVSGNCIGSAISTCIHVSGFCLLDRCLNGLITMFLSDMY